MADKQAGIYVSAISVLKRAIELDAANRLDEAVVCYQEGLQLLISYLKGNVDSIYEQFCYSFQHWLDLDYFRDIQIVLLIPK